MEWHCTYRLVKVSCKSNVTFITDIEVCIHIPADYGFNAVDKSNVLNHGILARYGHANVFIFKRAKCYLPSIYRPVSLTSICCEIQENILVSNIMSHSILYHWQYGFRAKHSTHVHNLPLSKIDVIILDFSKAFDRVSNKHLAPKLNYYETRGYQTG